MSAVFDITAKRSIVSVSLGDVLVEIRNGLVADQEKEQPGIPITRIETISKGVVDLERVRYVRNTAELKLDRFWLKSGDILFSHINSDLHLGKTAIVMSDAPLLHGMNLLVLRTDRERLLPKYLHYWLDCCRRSGVFMAIAQHAVNQSSLNQKKITSLKIPLPSINEQEKIVAELEKQFSRLDEAVANLQRVKANLKRYKASVLKEAVEGRLVPTEAELARRDGRSFETGEQLLQRILDARRAKWRSKGRYKEPLSHDPQALLDVPDGWTWCSLDAVSAETLLGLDRGRDQQRTDPVGVRYVKMNNVTMGGEVQIDDLVCVDASPEEVVRYELVIGDLLFNTRNSLELVGKVGIVRSVPARTVFNNNLMRIRTCSGVSSVFVGYQMCGPDFRQRMEKVKKATTSVAAVYQKDLLPLAIALPPEREQVRIVAEVDRHLSIIREVEAVVNVNLQRVQALRQATLAKAFSAS